jgi:hypothetical protein
MRYNERSEHEDDDQFNGMKRESNNQREVTNFKDGSLILPFWLVAQLRGIGTYLGRCSPSRLSACITYVRVRGRRQCTSLVDLQR